MVIFFHAFEGLHVFYPEYLKLDGTQPGTSFFVNGWAGVELFFVLSGFLIARPFIAHQKTDLKVYFWKRFLRIVPAYYTVMILCLVGAFPWHAVKIQEGEYLWTVAYHLLFMQDYFASNINVAFWTLGVEEKFYIIAPLLIGGLFTLYRKNIKWCAISIFATLVMSVIVTTWSYVANESPQVYTEFLPVARFPFHCCFTPFIMGMSIALLEDYKNRQQYEWQYIARYIFWIAAIFLAVFLFQQPMQQKIINVFDASVRPVLLVCIMAGLVGATVMGGAPKLLSIKPVRYISRISYGLYLIHFPLWPISYVLAIRIFGNQWNVPVFAGLFLLTYILVGICAATVLYYAVERPCLKYRDIKSAE